MPLIYFFEETHLAAANNYLKLRATSGMALSNSFKRHKGIGSSLSQVPGTLQEHESSYNMEKDSMNEDFVTHDPSPQSSEEEEEDSDEEFYTPGSDTVLEARKSIAEFSFEKAKERVDQQRHLAQTQDSVKILKHRRNIVQFLGKTELYGSQSIPNRTRPLSKVRAWKDYVAVGSWDGSILLLDIDTLTVLGACQPHSEKTTLDWHNGAIASGGGDSSLQILQVSEEISLDGTKGAELTTKHKVSNAHDGSRISDVKFHPSGKYIASTSFDTTWKLWDLEGMVELYQQEGHAKEIQCGAFQTDGSLFFSGGLDSIGRIWDLRLGRSIAVIQGHAKGIYGADWSPNGHHLATASGDCTVKIWDMRRINNDVATIPAHKKLVSDVRFALDVLLSTEMVTDANGAKEENLESRGTFLVTSSFDGELGIWNADNWLKISGLAGHNDKVMSSDVAQDGSIVSCGWDRTVKLWRA